MVRRHVHATNLHAVRQSRQGIDVDALAIDRDRYDRCPGGAERLPRRPIPELFDGDDIPGTQERPRCQCQRHLTAPCDEHVGGAGREAPGAGEHRGERGSQRRVFLPSLLRAIRYSLRTLRKTPAFTAGALLTIALTVGTTTAIFSVVYAVLLRELPYRNAEQVFWIWSDQSGRDRAPFNVPDFIDYRDSTQALSGFAGFFAYSANLSDETAAERVQGIRATGNFFGVLGAHARIGRLLAPSDERPDAARVVVLAEPF